MRKMLLPVLLAGLIGLPAAPALAQVQLDTAPKLSDSAPDRYVVVPGDTLWSIAAKFLKDPWRWPEMWKLNQDEIKNPHLIYPGDVIVLDRSGPKPELKMGETVVLSPRVRAEDTSKQAILAVFRRARRRPIPDPWELPAELGNQPDELRRKLS